MKKFIALILALLTALSMTALFSGVSFADETDDPDVTNEPTDGELPSSATLVGSPDLPPIGNQGEIGCCASMAITYMQFTNSVSRYIREYEPEKTFEPATGKAEYIMAPKWTYTLSGSGTAWVYNILCSQGAPTMAQSTFVVKRHTGEFLFHKANNRSVVEPTAVKWDVEEGKMEEAFNYRLADYEQIWMNDAFKVDGAIRITNSDKGKELIFKIKKSLLDGNVVVTGGFSSAWQYQQGLVDKGTLAKSEKEWALVCAIGDKTGGHQLSIVGYDDNIACKYKGVTLQGAFLVANSWGTSWMNQGYVWLMYDALNEISEFDKLNVAKRVISMDQFCFTDWRTDIVTAAPALYIEAEITADDREAFSATLQRRGVEDGRQSTVTPYIFTYASYHPKFNLPDIGGYYNFAGEHNGEACKGYFAFALDSLLKPEYGKSLKDYTFGLSLRNKGGNVALNAVRLKNAAGQVLSEITFENGEEVVSSSKTVNFDMTFCKLTFKDSEGVKFENKEGVYPVGSEVEFDVELLEGYVADQLTVTLEDGTELTKNENGKYLLTVNGDTAVSADGAQPEPEDVTPEPTPTPVTESETSEETDQTANSDESTAAEPASPSSQPSEKSAVKPGVIVAIACGCAALIILAVTLVLVFRKKKK